MAGKHPPLTALEIRKQLLVAEADMHREQLRSDLKSIRADLKHLEEKAKSAGTMISVIGLIATTVSLFRGRRKQTQDDRPSPLSSAFKLARVLASFLRAP
jgi:hypothetical protein